MRATIQSCAFGCPGDEASDELGHYRPCMPQTCGDHAWTGFQGLDLPLLGLSGCKQMIGLCVSAVWGRN
eukprot:7150064-Pyramimonas_sp.AAC.1